MLIRPLNVDDVDNWYAYLLKVAGQTSNISFSTADVKQRFRPDKMRGHLGNNDSNISFVAITDEKIVGLASISRRLLPRYLKRGELAISVDEDYWGQGIGSSLMAKVINYVQQNWQLSVIYLDVLTSNTRAIRLYEKFGFKISGDYPLLLTIDGHNQPGKLMYKQL
ncbi:MAG: GNAT family N-acetyltransferase [Oenococcus sp.]|uniref:GNAT family N-acetyltransferase n=1 Tax=Oenococcus TaxID=46254 RepID=UPI0021E7ACB5|nr:GNAT family N-acetyltransferase [Oenococcus kitaharae]MCV3295553.1 GNAT family N-acetyltransferase [Oenococcus kitaharae]